MRSTECARIVPIISSKKKIRSPSKSAMWSTILFTGVILTVMTYFINVIIAGMYFNTIILCLVDLEQSFLTMWIMCSFVFFCNNIFFGEVQNMRTFIFTNVVAWYCRMVQAAADACQYFTKLLMEHILPALMFRLNLVSNLFRSAVEDRFTLN